MNNIDINLSDYLNIDYLEEEKDSNDDITISTDNNSYNNYFLTTKQKIFKPKETGSYTIEYNNSKLSVNVYKKCDTFVISDGIRRSRNTNTTTFTFNTDKYPIELKHDGSSSNNYFGEIAHDITNLSNNYWEIKIKNWNYTYNNQTNNIRIGVVDRTDETNYFEFAETEAINPKIQANSVSSGYKSNTVSFSSNTDYTFKYIMDNGSIKCIRDGSEILSHSGYPSGEYTFFVMNENDSSSSASETSKIDEVSVKYKK